MKYCCKEDDGIHGDDEYKDKDEKSAYVYRFKFPVLMFGWDISYSWHLSTSRQRLRQSDLKTS